MRAKNRNAGLDSSVFATMQELSNFALPYGVTRDLSQRALCHHKLPRSRLERSRYRGGRFA
jgi:hypothetical protein